ncbi:MAG TPA: hypothetical protein VLV87_02365 [Gammaproteobacteria bacterium]|nr:hypothetical protein [Gammaproteobacteria bacterium]
MVSLAQLWLPILLGAVGAFVASSIIHMLLQSWHRTDYHAFPNEDEVRAVVSKGKAAPGLYILPWCPPETMKDPASIAKLTEGPVGFTILRAAGMPNMGKMLGLWFAFCLLVAIFAAYLASATLPAGTLPGQVFRVAATSAFMAFSFGVLPQAIWWGYPLRATVKDMIDGLIYAAIMGLVLAYMWPKGA